MRRQSGMWRIVWVVALLLGVVGTARAQVATGVEAGRTYTAWLYEGETDRLWERFGEPLRQLFGGVAGLDGFRTQVYAQLGAEAELLGEDVVDLGGETSYRRMVRFEKFGGPVLVTWVYDDAGAVLGFSVSPPAPPAPTRHEAYETRTPLRLPFDGEWAVIWGGRTVEQNYHAATVDQRFAYDLVVIRDGRRHRGDPTDNASYHCWGVPVVAPAAGRVVVARDGIADNRPGEVNPSEPAGNHVVLDHGNGEFSFLAHFREGSVKVAVGDVVEAGTVLGECGNSGNSSEPHLHYHLQSTPTLGEGEGLPAQFRDYMADGVTVERGEPIQGQRIRPASR